MRDFINFKQIELLTEVDSDIPLFQKVIKLQEECGELSQAYLGYCNAKNSSKSSSSDIMEVVEETCDVINVAINILNQIENNAGVKSDAIKDMFQRKLDKWESKTSLRGKND